MRSAFQVGNTITSDNEGNAQCSFQSPPQGVSKAFALHLKLLLGNISQVIPTQMIGQDGWGTNKLPKIQTFT